MNRFDECEEEDNSESNDSDSDSHSHSSHKSDSSSPSSSKSHSFKSSKSKSSHSSSSHSRKKSSSLTKTDKLVKEDKNIKDINLDTLFLKVPKPEEIQNNINSAAKLAYTHYNVITNLKPNSFLYHPQSKTTYTVLNVKKDKQSPSIKIQNKDNDQDPQITVSLDTFNQFTLHREVRVLYINKLNRTKELSYPVNINASFQDFYQSFSATYKFFIETMTIIYKEAKVKINDREMMKFANFDFDNDYLIVLEDLCEMSYTIEAKETYLSFPRTSTYVALINSNLQLKGIRPAITNKLQSFYLEIYKLNIKFDRNLDDEIRPQLAKQLLKANWRTKAALVYTLPLMKTNAKEDEMVPFFQNVLLNEKTVYVIVMHLSLVKRKSVKVKIKNIWKETEFTLISENERFCFDKIYFSPISELYLTG